MSNLADGIFLKGVEQGYMEATGGKAQEFELEMVKGSVLGYEEGVIKTFGSNIKSLMANLGCSLEKALELLGIPQSEKDALLTTLGYRQVRHCSYDH